MAVPTPQTPSTQYGVVNVTAETIFVELTGNKFLTVIAAASKGYTDMPRYNGGNYRDVVDAAFLGRAPVSVIQNSGATVDNPFNGDLVTTTSGSVFPDQIATMMQQDDNFAHVIPHPELTVRTIIQWWDTTGGTGKVVGSCWADTFIGESGAIPQSNGSVPPQFTNP